MDSRYIEIAKTELSRLDNSNLSLENIPRKYVNDLRLLHNYITCLELGMNTSFVDCSISDNVLKYISSELNKIGDKNLRSYYEMEIKDLYGIFKHTSHTEDEKLKYTKELTKNCTNLFSGDYNLKKYQLDNISTCSKLYTRGITYQDIKDLNPSYYKLLVLDSDLDFCYKYEICTKCSENLSYDLIRYTKNTMYPTIRGYLDSDYIWEILFALKYDIDLGGIDIKYWTPEQLHEILVAKKYGVDISQFTKDDNAKYIANTVSLFKLQQRKKTLKNLKII